MNSGNINVREIVKEMTDGKETMRNGSFHISLFIKLAYVLYLQNKEILARLDKYGRREDDTQS